MRERPSSKLRIRIPPQHGLTLVELMIAMVLGLVLLAGVVQIFISSQQAYRTQESLSRVQENGRFALETMSYDIRHAGFRGGCIGGIPINNLLDIEPTDADFPLYDLDTGLQGWNGIAGPFANRMNGYVAGTDVVLIRNAATHSGVTANGNTPANAANINLNTASGIARGTIVIVADADGCDIFQNASNNSATNLNRGNPGANHSPGNRLPAANNPFSKAYGPDMDIMTLTSSLYYVGASATPNQTALRRVQFNRGTGAALAISEELIDGVIDMQIEYGVDTTNVRNFQVDQYFTAEAVPNWDRVLAVRLNLLIRDANQNVMPEPVSLVFNNAIFAAPANDRRMHQAFSTTVGTRNALP